MINKIKNQFSKRKKMISYMFITILAITTGMFLGNWYNYIVAADTFDYDSLNENEFITTPDEVICKLLNTKHPTQHQLKNWVSELHNKNITPQNLSAADNFILAQYKIETAKSFSAIGHGRVETIANQTVFSSKKFDGQNYSSTSISKGLISIADYTVYNPKLNEVKNFKGKNIKETNADWDKNHSSKYTYNDYKECAGVPIDKISLYIISDKTILNKNAKIEQIKDKSNKTNYKFTMLLDPVKSTIQYAKLVKLNSGLSSYPYFKDINLTVIIDNSWNLILTDVVENYRIAYGVLNPKCTGYLTTQYQINTNVTI